ncbi:TetR/AcrR family transcriptional regulator [Aeromicrobium sp. CTD01-1L150]|uniref:TetR/AcrR family transcriptional regulator n=1 Tax=Aeromicrobium sp. CTD01-1L150 TaxID=3341830 RepID=UPI0035C1006D
MSEQVAAPRRRPGGRSARVARAVFDATITLLVESGYDRLTLENVAVRARVNKTTVYRRWRTKSTLVAQACLEAAEREIPIPDNGNLRDDLRALLTEIAALLARDVEGTVARVVVGGAAHSPELREALQSFWRQRVAPAANVVERAVARGELPAGTDPAVLIETAAAALWMRRLVSGLPLNDAFVDQVVELLLNGAMSAVAESPPGE